MLTTEHLQQPLSPRPGTPKDAPPTVDVPQHPAARQQPDHVVFKSKGRRELTPVFGTSVPPKGLSGVLRAQAYAIADHNPAHWQLLVLADRVDVWESRITDAAQKHPIALAVALGAGLYLAGRLLIRPTRRTVPRRALKKLRGLL